MCWKSWKSAAGCWAAKAPATCWRWTSTPRATASISALQVLQACVRSGRSLASCWKDVTLFPQTLINVG